MKRSTFIFVILLSLLLPKSLPAESRIKICLPEVDAAFSDTIPDDQLLFNGRVWHNLYLSVEGDQFFFSKEFLPGSVTMRGRTYSDIMINYDIFKDEILIPYKPVGILQLNKEMVDSFSISHLNRRFHFVRITDSTNAELNGYFNDVYNGETNLYIRYIKKIEKFADGGKYDKFYQENRIFLKKDGKVHLLKGKNDLLRIFNNENKTIRNYINKSNLRISKTEGESFVPVLRFLDELKRQR